MSMWEFPFYEMHQHPVSGVGIILLIVFIVVTLFYCRIKGVKYKIWILHNIKFYSLMVLICMMLARPFFTYYSPIAEWLACITIAGVVIAYKKLQADKIKFKIEKFHNRGPFPINQLIKPLFTVKNCSGKHINRLKFKVYVRNITKINDNSITISLNKPFDYSLIGHDKPINVLRNRTLFKIISHNSRYSYGNYDMTIRFLCLNNYQMKDVKITYDYEKDSNNSKVTKINL